MVFLAFAILLVAAGASESTAEEGCYVQAHSACRSKSPWTDFPGSAEEFDAFCEHELPYFDCYTNHSTECNPDSEAHQITKKLEVVLRHICDKDTRLYNDIVRILPCVQPKMESIFYCTGEFYTDEFLEDYRTSLSKHGVHNVTGEDNIRTCLLSLYVTGCSTVSAGRECGEVAKSIMIDMYQLWQVPFRFCNSEVADKFPAIVRAMEDRNE